MLALGEYPRIQLAGRKGEDGEWVAGARERRDAARAMLLRNVNPSAHQRAQRTLAQDRSANTFGTIANEWFVQNSHRLTSGTIKRDRRVVEKDLATLLNISADEIKASDILAALARSKAVEPSRLRTGHVPWSES